MHQHPLLKVENLKKSYSGKLVVDGLSFDIKPGEVVGLLGPNGAGKTTAFYMAIGLIHPDDGKVFFKGHDTTSIVPRSTNGLSLAWDISPRSLPSSAH